MLKSLLVFLKGFFIGGTMTVPGVSGGSMAMILGIYNQLISAIGSFRKDPKKNTIFLIKFLLGSVVGIVLFSKYALVPLMALFPMPTRYFFLGAVAGGVPMIFKTAGVKKVSLSAFIYPIIGVIAVLLIALVPEGLFAPTQGFSISEFFLQLLGGIVIAVALILPGISVSQMLLMLGLYYELLAAIDTFNILPFIPLGIGVVIGSLLCAKLMEKAMKKFPQPTYLIVFGFLLGSLPLLMLNSWSEIFPTLLTSGIGVFINNLGKAIVSSLPSGINIPICIVTAFCGFCAIYFLQVFENKKL